ncbi:MAG: T9SS type A sorting domain-containing protein [Taibaiella sp.]|jgi:hypothetical protein
MSQLTSTLFKALAFAGLISALQSNAQSTQAVTGAITTYGGYWKSTTDSMNLVKPDNSHDLLAFRFNNVMYSTGVNDAALISNSETFVPQEYQSLPITSITGTVGANTKAALGQMYDGVDNGPSVPPPANSIPLYLTDGVQGLNLGTGIANLPSGTLSFDMPILNTTAIGDGVPDILISQIAQPSGGVDYYKFTDVNGDLVGDSIAISFSGIDSIGNWTGDFYEASANPMTLAVGFTKSDRSMRLWAADLSTFGINATNAASVEDFAIRLNGNSDVAFIAYNTGIGVILPVTYTYFNARKINNDVRLTWETAQEINSDYFEIQTSVDGKSFIAVDHLKAAGNSSTSRSYTYIDKNITAGDHFYRLKQVDRDGKSEYSSVRLVENNIIDNRKGLLIAPNPASGNIHINVGQSNEIKTLNIYTVDGKKIFTKNLAITENETSVSTAGLQAGTYIAELRDANGNTEYSKFTVQK